eukprot:TRINITY_DN24120_c0_g1_i1.p1 TRINITY_DN24120_c0_g1~~TRINITY_DN24120_c0_g1_i1.p1  ORF type:complete len:325 (-),score=53.11 TRINITY_DN24120_c0_g1_i1:7-915(-)
MCVLESNKSLMVVLALFSLVVYMFAIGISFQASDYLKPVADMSQADWWDHLEHHTEDHVREIWKTFGNLWRTVYTLYQVALGGVNWGEVCNPLLQTGDVLPALLLCYVTFMLIGVLNVVGGLFLEDVLRFAQNQRNVAVRREVTRSREYMKRLVDFFSSVDAEMDGQLSVEELLVLLHDESLSAYFRILEFQVDDMEEVEQFIRLLDVDESGTLSLEEFVKGCRKFKGPAQVTDVHQVFKETRHISKRLDALHQQGINFMSRLELIESSGKLHKGISDACPSSDSSGTGHRETRSTEIGFSM